MGEGAGGKTSAAVVTPTPKVAARCAATARHGSTRDPQTWSYAKKVLTRCSQSWALFRAVPVRAASQQIFGTAHQVRNIFTTTVRGRHALNSVYVVNIRIQGTIRASVSPCLPGVPTERDVCICRPHQTHDAVSLQRWGAGPPLQSVRVHSRCTRARASRLHPHPLVKTCGVWPPLSADQAPRPRRHHRLTLSHACASGAAVSDWACPAGSTPPTSGN